MTLRFAGRARRFALALTVAAMALAGLATPASAAVSFRTVATGLSSPVFVTHANDSRLFIVEQTGRIRVRQTSGALGTFLDIRSRVLFSGERGLFSVAFHPDYTKAGTWGYRRFYVNYTNGSGDIILSEFQRFSTNPNAASPSTERRLLTIGHRTYSNHNGGQVAFGPDRLLYLSTGDGGGAGDPLESGQRVNTLLGKLIRIDPRPSTSYPYTIPTTNPWYGPTYGYDQIWAIGLRNPWRFSWDTMRGDLYVADVGQGSQEEVNRSRSDVNHFNAGRGLNYGWDCYEGTAVYESTGCSPSGKTFPLATYGTHANGGCAVTGGYVERRTGNALYGKYIFGDYCNGRIWTLNADSNTSPQAEVLIRDTAWNITSFGRGYGGRLYVVSYAGAVYEIVAT
jgi:glucose/arabinose dehydrogenase